MIMLLSTTQFLSDAEHNVDRYDETENLAQYDETGKIYSLLPKIILITVCSKQL